MTDNDDGFVVRVPTPGHLTYQQTYNEQRLPTVKDQPFDDKVQSVQYIVFDRPNTPNGVDFSIPAGHMPENPEWSRPPTIFETRGEAEIKVRKTIARSRVRAEAGERPGLALHLKYAQVITLAEMNADDDVRHDIEQAKLTVQADTADRKVKEAQKDAEKIREQLAAKPTSSWSAHPVGGGVNHRVNAAGDVIFSRRRTVDGKPRPVEFATLNEALAWQPDKLPERSRTLTDDEIESIA